MAKKTTIHIIELLRLCQRYWPLIDYLENNRGYGNYEVVMHGKRPKKARESGPWTNFAMPELDVLVQDVTAADILAALGGTGEPTLTKE
jgi:hypothetical protein